MFDNYLVEVDDRAAGILMRAGNGFVFHAVSSVYSDLEGVVFPHAVAAERAARRHLGRRAARRHAAAR